MDVPVKATRGTAVHLELAFYEDPETKQVPLVPKNPAIWPQMTVRDPSGQVMANQVGRLISPGIWAIDYFVLTDATLSTDSSKWSVTGSLVTASGRQSDQVLNFDVVDVVLAEPAERSFTFLFREGTGDRVILKRATRPAELTLSIYAQHDTVAMATASLADDTIKESVKGQLHGFWYDTPALTCGEYLVEWIIREDDMSPTERQLQVIRVPPTVFWFLEPSLRELIDRLMKRANRIGSYGPATMYEYLSRGVDILNQYMPVTDFSLATFPFGGGAEHFLLEAAAAHAMQAQGILAVELDFAFQGQTVPITVDRAQGYAAAYERMMQDLNQRWPTTKLHLYRRSTPLGVVGVRQIGRRQQHQVVKLNSAGFGLMANSLMSSLGLL